MTATLAIGAPASAAGSTRYVATTGSDTSNDCLTLISPCLTIQHAISQAAAGDTVKVAAGTYTETGQIVINKDLSIVGASKYTTIIKPAQDTVGNNVDTAAWILVNSGMTFNLSRVTLDGDSPTIKTNWGIASYGSGTIKNNIIKNIKEGTYYGRGIVVFGNMTIHNNTFENIERIGIHIRGAYSGPAIGSAIVKGNTYTGKGTGDFLDYGVEVGAGASATIIGNTITNCRGVAATDGSTSAGILVTDYYGTGTTANIRKNTINNCTDGIAVGYLSTDVSVVAAHNNDLSGNDYGIASTGPLVDATCNWWGAANGPGVIASGSGSKVTADVTYSPWLHSSNLNGRCGPKHRHHHDDGHQGHKHHGHRCPQ